MDKKNTGCLLLGILLGILFVLLFSSGSNGARYVPFGSGGNQILDTRTGRLYNISGDVFGNAKKWLLTVHEVGSHPDK